MARVRARNGVPHLSQYRYPVPNAGRMRVGFFPKTQPTALHCEHGKERYRPVVGS